MDEIVKKITKYNLFNYLLPGVIFIIFVSYTTKFNLLEKIGNNVIILLFLAYFLGSVISRAGSLIVEPFLKKIKFVKFVEYDKYLQALEKDKKIDILSQENNTYRTYIAIFLFVLSINLVMWSFDYLTINMGNKYFYISIFLLIIFLFSYKKQTMYIKKRVINKLKK